MAKRAAKKTQPPSRKEKDAERQRQKRRDNPLTCLLRDARYRAKRGGILFDLFEDDVEVNEHCPLCGVALKVSDGYRSDDSPSLERLVPDCGYTPGNVIYCCWLCNRSKSDNTPHRLIQLGIAHLTGFSDVSEDEAIAAALHVAEQRRLN